MSLEFLTNLNWEKKRILIQTPPVLLQLAEAGPIKKCSPLSDASGALTLVRGDGEKKNEKEIEKGVSITITCKNKYVSLFPKRTNWRSYYGFLLRTERRLQKILPVNIIPNRSL